MYKYMNVLMSVTYKGKERDRWGRQNLGTVIVRRHAKKSLTCLDYVPRTGPDECKLNLKKDLITEHMFLQLILHFHSESEVF